jgi:hypothetical protein
MAVASVAPKALHKKLVKRAPPDCSQSLRRVFQFGFLALNLWLGIEFYGFVRYY